MAELAQRYPIQTKGKFMEILMNTFVVMKLSEIDIYCSPHDFRGKTVLIRIVRFLFLGPELSFGFSISGCSIKRTNVN